MGFFSGSFGKGLVAGVAQGASRTIQQTLDKREEEMSTARKYMQTRRMQEAERYESDMAETEELLTGFAQLTGGNLDQAAQLVKRGGGIEGARNLLTLLNEEAMKNADFDVSKAYTFAESQAGEAGMADYLRTLVTDPKQLAMPESKKIGLGLADKILGKQEDPFKAPTVTGRKIDIGTAAQQAGAFSMAQEYEDEQTLTNLSIEKARADIAKIQGEIGTKDAYTNATLRNNIAIVESSAAGQLIPTTVDANGNTVIDLQTAHEQNIDVRDAVTEVVSQSTKMAYGAKGTLNDSGNIQTLIAKASAKDPKGNYIVKFQPKTDKPEIGSVYKLKNNETI